MANNYSNVVSPAQKALSNKIAPPSLASYATSGVPKTTTSVSNTTPQVSSGTGLTSLLGINKGAISQPKVAAPVKGAIPTNYTSPTAGVASSSSLGLVDKDAIQSANNQYGSTASTIAGGSSTQSGYNPNPGNNNPNSGTQGVTYPGLVSALGNQQNSPQNQQSAQSTNALNTLSQTNPGTSGVAFDAYTKAVSDQQKLKSGIAQQYGNIESTPIPLEFQQGRQQVLARQYASQLDAAQQAVNQQQAAIGYQIQGQGVQNTGYGTAGGLANTSQSNAQSALGTAAGYAAPQAYGLTSQPYNPLTDTYGGGGTGGALGRAQLAGQIDATQATASSQNQQVQQFKSSLQQGQNLQSQLNDLITTFNINPNDVNAVNTGIQKIAQNTSSPQYKALENLVTDIVSTYSAILTPGSTTDTARATAASLLDASAKGQSIIATMKGLDEQAKAKIAGVLTQGATSGSTGGTFTGDAWK